MGTEIRCRAIWQEKQGMGKALLESDHVLFRGDFRCKIWFRDLLKVVAEGATLRLLSSDGELQLEIGENAKSWAAKILQPKSRAAKLGIKPGVKVVLVGLQEWSVCRRDCAIIR
jgi:hypothetical protein